MRLSMCVVGLFVALSVSQVQAQFVNLGIYDVGAHAGGGVWTGPDGRIGGTTDVYAVIDYLNGAPGTIPTWPGTSYPTLDVTSTQADLNFQTRDNVISPIDALLIINHLNGTSYHRNPDLAFDVNDDTYVSPIDALIVINYLNSGQSPSPPIVNVADQIFAGFGYPNDLVYSLKTSGGTYLDVSGNNLVESEDVWLVINYLNGG